MIRESKKKNESQKKESNCKLKVQFLLDFRDRRAESGLSLCRGVLSDEEEPLFNFDDFCPFATFSLPDEDTFPVLALLNAASDATAEVDFAREDVEAVATEVVEVAVRGWDWTRYLGLTCTSQGGGALLYDGTILNVTDPRASLCNKSTNNMITNVLICSFNILH